MAEVAATLTIVGNLTADPELRFTPNGVAVSNFTIASTPRVFDNASKEWKDGEALFMRCNVWKDAAENVADSLYKGVRVIATGKIKQRSWEDKDGNKRTTVELDVEELGPSLKFAQVSVEKKAKANYGGDPWSGSNDDSPF